MTEEIENRLAEIVEQLERIADALEKEKEDSKLMPSITLDDYS